MTSHQENELIDVLVVVTVRDGLLGVTGSFSSHICFSPNRLLPCFLQKTPCALGNQPMCASRWVQSECCGRQATMVMRHFASTD